MLTAHVVRVAKCPRSLPLSMCVRLSRQPAFQSLSNFLARLSLLSSNAFQPPLFRAGHNLRVLPTRPKLPMAWPLSLNVHPVQASSTSPHFIQVLSVWEHLLGLEGLWRVNYCPICISNIRASVFDEKLPCFLVCELLNLLCFMQCSFRLK